MNILDELQQSHGSAIQQHLVRQLGLNPQQAAGALQKAGPLILAALKRQKDTQGEERLQGQMEQYGDVDLSDPGSVQSAPSDLGGLLGGQEKQASQHLAQHLGISPGMALKLLPILAPFIIGMLKKKAGSMPGGTPGSGSGGLGSLISILDRDGDGQILDDLSGMLAGGANKAGCLSALLGGMLKKK